MQRRNLRFSSSIDNIPQEIWREILSYLPAKSLVRFRSVSKAWRFIIEEPEFAVLHLQHCPKNSPEPLIIVGETVFSGGAISRWALRCSSTFQELSEMKFPPLDHDSNDYLVNGARDGLLLLQGSTDTDIVLWNPSIRKTVNIPLPPPLPNPLLNRHNKRVDHMSVLGFDPSCDDYKVVSFIRHRDHRKRFPDPWPSFQVFSLKNRSWVEVAYNCSPGNSSPPHNLVHRYWNNLSIGEYIHWLATRCVDGINPSGYVVSLNLVTMTISYNPLPVEISVLWNPYITGNSVLGVATFSRIWAFEGVGSPADGLNNRGHNKTCARWSNKYDIDETVTAGVCRGLHLTNDGLLLLLKNLEKKICVYDLKTRQMKRVVSATMCPMYVHKHIESLVLLTYR